MATIGSRFGRFLGQDKESPAGAVPARDAATRLRPFPNEDIYFFVKHIDNSSVVRQADPERDRANWRMIGAAALAAALVVAVLMPEGYGLLAGYRLRRLEAEHKRLLQAREVLWMEESSVLTPQRMLELAKQQQFVDPPAERVVYLDNASDVEFAAAQPKR
jgi:hypothetical protein